MAGSTFLNFFNHHDIVVDLLLHLFVDVHLLRSTCLLVDIAFHVCLLLMLHDLKEVLHAWLLLLDALGHLLLLFGFLSRLLTSVRDGRFSGSGLLEPNSFSFSGSCALMWFSRKRRASFLMSKVCIPNRE